MIDQYLLPRGSVAEAHLLEDWSWLSQSTLSVLAITKMGDAFATDPTETVHFLDTLEGNLKFAASSIGEFWSLARQGRLDPAWFNPDMLALLEAREVPLEPGQCYGYKLPPVLGGPLGFENVEAFDAVVYFSITGQLHRQVKDLPLGAKISGFSVSP